MNIESPKVTADKSQQEMFNFLTKVENYEQLMPESKEVFEVRDEKTFVFGLKGMPVIKLEIQETIEPELVVLGSTSDKFDFKLKAHIEALSENQSEVKMEFNGEFNAMMAMMVKKPLTKFINTLAENIGKL
ncbi:SRPBCC family protein [Salegentibacter agarivorans]|jgi:ribosome-associated toxin RatA of RatAB toxin-antitoxin module|uniref:SRPBCC family protein n=1 Tax=uncultured Salegentibacter sp. TaxID=259320 RepID=UPI0030D92546|tara:strand:+ start:335 stop:727 length:393 start_codon:yes stop_codon:yes gene_type:complete